MTGDTTFKEGPIAWMARNPVAANLLMLVCIVGGLLSLKSITQEVFPDIQEDLVSVSVAYPGASPEEVERGIIQSIEESLLGLDGIEEINSTAAEGRGTITASLIEGADPITIYQNIRSEVDRITTLPVDAERPEVNLNTHRRSAMSIVLYGSASDAVLKEMADRVRERFLEDENITQVTIEGSRSSEIQVEIPQEQLRRHGLTLLDVASRIRAAAVELPGGGIDADTGEILLRMTERRDRGHEFSGLPIVTGTDGTLVRLEDIAVIRDGLEDAKRYATYNGMPAVLLDIARVGKQTPQQVAKAVEQRLEIIRTELPDGIQCSIRQNWADIYLQRANLLIRNGLLGLGLVLLLLGLFLELRLAFWVMMGIPVSFLGSLLFLPAVGLSLNMITLFAYLLALGIVVDDAIVVGENVYRHHQDGLPFMQAAILGTREVSSPVAFSILTNMVAFLPIMVLPGMMGRVMGMLPIIVIIVFTLSWIESIYVLPAHLAHQGRQVRQGSAAWLHGFQRRFSDAFLRWVRTRYAPFLDRCLSHRYLVVSLAIGILALTIGYIKSGRLGFETFPRVESDFAYVSAVLPYGSPIERTAAIADRLVQSARTAADESGYPAVIEGIFANIGSSGTHELNVRVYLADKKIREQVGGTAGFTESWRQATGTLKGVESVRFESDRGGPGGGSALTIELSHHRVRVLEQAAATLAGELESFSRVSDIDNGFQRGKEQLSFTVRPEGQSLGLTAQEIARQVRNAYEGVEVLRQQRGRHEVKLRLRLPESERMSESSLKAMLLRIPGGGEVPLGEVVNVSRGRAFTTIAHRNGRRTMTVTADVRPRSETGQVTAELDATTLPHLLRQYPGLTCSYEGRQAEDRKSMGSLGITIPLVLIAIYALLAVPFRSYVQPLIVMMSIPFGLVGAVLGHLIMGYSLSMIGIIGIVALSGVVINDALVLVDFINGHRREASTTREAVIKAGVTRFRPILLTTLTTFGGVAPMIFETSRQARFLIPMAISLGYGLLFATMITLVLVPSLYLIIDDIKSLFQGSVNKPEKPATDRTTAGRSMPA